MVADSGKGGKDGPDMRAFTVKEVAAILRVSTATVYAMVERGELLHVRVRNAIRVVVALSETTLDARPEPR
jgi:excisionase family DNA binding protein